MPAYVWHVATVVHQVFMRKVRFLLRLRQTENLISSLLVSTACIYNKYSANKTNIYACIRRSAFGRE